MINYLFPGSLLIPTYLFLAPKKSNGNSKKFAVSWSTIHPAKVTPSSISVSPAPPYGPNQITGTTSAMLSFNNGTQYNIEIAPTKYPIIKQTFVFG